MRSPVFRHTNTQVIWNCHLKKTKQKMIIKSMSQVLFPGLGCGDCLNNASSFWAFLCPSWCKPWVLTKTDWILKEGYYTAFKNLIFLGTPGVKALFFLPLYVPNLACDSFEWHEKQQAGCESPLLSSFLTFKICLARTQHSPSPSSNPFCPPAQLTKTQWKTAFFPDC